MAKEVRTAIILLILHTSTAKPDKSTGPAVFEVINEQARIDDKKTLPYENPLAGKSIQNAKLHAQHQQAMFNAERIRQHRAQILRWNNQHPKQHVDSYMKAYQESQENHHHTLEQSQPNSKEKKIRGRSEQSKSLKDNAQIEPEKDTTTDNVNKKRNHRSYGTVHTGIYKKRKIHMYPGPTYDQGVTIKSNGNLGLYNYAKEHTGLYTSVIPSSTRNVHPKLYSQPMYAYESAKDISTLSSLLSQSPQEQLIELNTLIHTPTKTESDVLDTHNNLYIYLNEPQSENEGAVTSLTESAGENTGGYIIHNDFKPITEEVDDIQDDRDHRMQFIQPTLPTVLTQMYDNANSVSTELPKNIQYSSYAPSYDALKYEIPVKYETSSKYETPLKYETPSKYEIPSTYETALKYEIPSTYETPSKYEIPSTYETPLKYEIPSTYETPLKYETSVKYEIPSKYETVSKYGTPSRHETSSKYGTPSRYETPVKYETTSKYETASKFYINVPNTEGVKYLKSQPTVIQHLNQDGTGVSAYGDDDIHYASKYEFGYRVRDHKSGNDYGHQEAKSGDKTQGQYHVLLPDGRMQQVRYSAGPGGFHADISYDHLQQANLKN